MKALASLALRDLVIGPPRAGVVSAVFGAAAYAEVDGSVLALETADGVRLPNAVTLPVPAAARPLRGLVPGAPATVGEGSVRLGSIAATVADWWDPTVVGRSQPRIESRTGTPPVEELARLAGPWPMPGDIAADALRRGARDLQAALVTLDGVAREAAAGRRAGRGGGTTPAGDDLLAGALAVLRALRGPGDALADALAAAVRPHLRRTTSLSATLLRHAARGEVAEPAQAVLAALAAPERLPLAVQRLLAIGHSSGRDLAAGISIGGRAALRSEAAA
jgi:hypothetical protein